MGEPRNLKVSVERKPATPSSFPKDDGSVGTAM